MCNHLMSFYISLEKLCYLCNSMTDLHKIWHDNAEHVSSAPPIKKFCLKTPDGRRPIRLRDLFCIIMRYCNLSIFKMAAVRHLGIMKKKFLTAPHLRDTFYIIRLNFVQIGQTTAEI